MSPEAIPELRDSTPAEKPGLTNQQVDDGEPPRPETRKPSLTPEQRVERAKQAAAARWAKVFDWETCSLEDGLARLAELRAETEKAGLTMQRRISQEARVEKVLCYGSHNEHNPCKVIIDVGAGRFAGSRTRHNPATGLTETAYACSAACFMYLGKAFLHSQAPPRG